VGRLFEPFQRLGTERVRTADRGGHADAHARRQAPGQAVGYGLGLAIVRAIAGVHNATLAAHARPDGGLTVEVSFPGTRQPALNSSPANSPD
jgi:signal transduction histidine kinase